MDGGRGAGRGVSCPITNIFLNMHSCQQTCLKRWKTLFHSFYLSYIIDDGGYSEWSSWTQCSTTCGNGRRSRSRSCTNPPPSPGGKDCSQLGPEKETGECNSGGCPGMSYDATKIFKNVVVFTASWLQLLTAVVSTTNGPKFTAFH